MGGKIRRLRKGRSLGLAMALAAVLLCAACNPATVAFREGRKAEEQKDYDSAVIDFQKALKYQPANARYLLYQKEARTEASLFHAKQGERLLAQNRPDAASGEFQKAVSIDPSNMAAAQNLERIVLQQTAVRRRHEQAIRKAMEQEEASRTNLGVQLKPLSTQPIARLHLSADSRTVFETLGKLAGINVVFYYDFQPKPVSLDMSDVTIQEALQAAADEAAVFWKVISRNSILIIPDTPGNRRELETQTMQTVYLQNPSAAADRAAILTAIKQVVGVQKAYENPDSDSITLYDTPEKVSAAVALIHSLDRGKAEVLVQVTVLEADKDRLNDLGLAPVPLGGTQATMAAVGLNSAPAAAAGGATTPVVTLNELGRLSTGNFSIALPGIIANALLSDTRTHILQNPQIRVTAGDTARLRIGQRVPFATGSFGVPTAGVTGAGTGGFGLLANTQFQYQDVGVNLDITPDVAANGDIILRAKIDISAVGTPSNIGGVEEPTFTQRTIEHVIRLKEGEVSLLGGLMQSQTTHISSGLPGLGEVPVLRYFFSTQSFETTDEE
ncbi:MAG: hypothetical protein ACRD10_07005, partial [Terriglobia bacterium]